VLPLVAGIPNPDARAIIWSANKLDPGGFKTTLKRLN
jgi:hypothetical protein